MSDNFLLDLAQEMIRNRDVEIERLRADASVLRQAIGLATTAVPTMVMDPADPVGMMARVVSEIERLRAELKHVYELRATEAHEDQEMVERLERERDTLRALLARCRPMIGRYPMPADLCRALLADLDAALKDQP